MAGDTLETSFYLILSGARERNYNWRKLVAQRIVRTTTKLPATKRDEVAIRVTVTLPVALFERPELTVAIQVDGSQPRVNIDAETMDDLAARMEEIIGTPVLVTVDLPEGDEDAAST